MSEVKKFWDKEGILHYSERLELGGMFQGQKGVFESEGQFYAFVKDGWGTGGYSKGHPDQQTAMADIVRLRRKFFK